jgi:CubicO group peptidase (beta-lactamase class C family)
MPIKRPTLLNTMALAVLLVVAPGCRRSGQADRSATWRPNIVAFEEEIQSLQSVLAIPGLAYAIVENGKTIATTAFGVEQGSGGRPFATSTPLRIASVTKTVTAVVALQLVEEGKLDLDAPARRYASSLRLPDDVLIRHLLTHTSEGHIGVEYVYGTTRYAMLEEVIEAILGESFETVIRERILERARMQVHPSPALGAHAGLVSTTDDMAAYLAALDRGELLRPASMARLESPSRSAAGTQLPVSLGWFTQTVQGQQIVWSFGQDDPEHSGALLVRIPARNLSLFVLGNANVLSDPFRLLMADGSKSLFAMSFLRLFAFSAPGRPLPMLRADHPAIERHVADLEVGTTYRYRDELFGWTLIDLWNDRGAAAQRKHDIARTRYRDDTLDAVMHFAALRLPDLHSKDQALQEGARLLEAHPMNRWVLLAQGYLFQQRGRMAEGSKCFEDILELPNQEPDFLRRLFRAWSWMALAQMSAQRDAGKARAYLREIIASGVTGGLLEDARRMLEDLGRRRPQ